MCKNIAEEKFFLISFFAICVSWWKKMRVKDIIGKVEKVQKRL